MLRRDKEPTLYAIEIRMEFRPDYSAHKRGKLLDAKKHITGRR